MEKLIHRLFIDAKRNKDLKAMKSLHNGYPNDSTIKFEYAFLLKMYGYYDEAKQLFIELLDTRNADYAMIELGIMAENENDLPKAREYFEKVARYGDNYALFHLARLDRLEKKYNKARKELQALLSTKMEGVKTELGRLEAEAGNISEARRIFENMKEKDNDPHGDLELGKLEKGLGNYEEAKRIFRELVDSPLHYSALIELGLCEAHSNNYDEAEKYFLDLVDTPVKSITYRLLALLYVKKQEYLKAYKVIKEAMDNGIDINPYVIMDVTKNLNVLFNMDYEKIKYNYSMDQLINYDSYLGLDHVMYRHGEEPNRDFRDDIDVPLLFNTIKEQLVPENKVKGFNYNDIYVVPYNNAGKHNENYIRVITLPNTKDIITMYPVPSKYDFVDDIEEELTNKEKML